LFRLFFPSFEKPVDRPRYLNIEQESRSYHGVWIVLLLAAVCGIGFSLWEPSHQVTSPFVSASTPPAAAKAADTTAAAPQAEEETVAPTVKLSTLCSQRATARRDCASVKAFKDARLNAPEPAAEPAKESKHEVATKAVAPALASVATVTPPAAEPDASAAAAPKAPPAQKAKRPRPAEEAPVERLVKVYDQVLPDGRRVPVYKRAGTGALETGTIVDGEYRPARRANLDPPSNRYFGLQ